VLSQLFKELIFWVYGIFTRLWGYNDFLDAIYMSKLRINLMNIDLKVFLILTSSILAFSAKAQDCNIQVKSEIIHATAKEEGSVSFLVDGQTGSTDYSIFRLGADHHKSNIVSTYSFNELPVGVTEFIIIDRKKKSCIKEVQVKIEKY
jgi:hypothetical protein